MRKQIETSRTILVIPETIFVKKGLLFAELKEFWLHKFLPVTVWMQIFLPVTVLVTNVLTRNCSGYICSYL